MEEQLINRTKHVQQRLSDTEVRVGSDSGSSVTELPVTSYKNDILSVPVCKPPQTNVFLH